MHITSRVNINNSGLLVCHLEFMFEIILYLCGMQCFFSMEFLCDFAHGYLKNCIWKIIWIEPFQLLLCMIIYLIGMLTICYPSIVFISKLSCYACVSIDDHVLIWFLHRMITRNTILFEFILLLYMRVCYLIVYI